MPSVTETVRRLWQPRRGLFWLVVALQLLSSAIVLFIQVAQPPDALRLVFGLMALTDSLLAWWLTLRLWREAEHPPAPLRGFPPP